MNYVDLVLFLTKEIHPDEWNYEELRKLLEKDPDYFFAANPIQRDICACAKKMIELGILK